MYEQNLVKTITPIRQNIIKRLNKQKKWEYGYNKEHDIIVISKTGQIGEIVEIQNLPVALPLAPKNIVNTNNKWVPKEHPKELDRIRTIFDWEGYPETFKNKWYD